MIRHEALPSSTRHDPVHAKDGKDGPLKLRQATTACRAIATLL